jgi:hypothetical protein
VDLPNCKGMTMWLVWWAISSKTEMMQILHFWIDFQNCHRTVMGTAAGLFTTEILAMYMVTLFADS